MAAGVKTFYYGSGGYITKGSSVCQLGPILQEKLKKAVIDAVLKFYEPYLSGAGRKRLSTQIHQQRLADAQTHDWGRFLAPSTSYWKTSRLQTESWWTGAWLNWAKSVRCYRPSSTN
jgi:hypothetical protein